MSEATPPARYDSPWKSALTHAFRDFMAFFFAELCGKIDWSKRPRFRDKELTGISFGDVPDGLIADKLVEVLLRDGRVQWVLIHVEVQADADPNWRPQAFHNHVLGTVMGISFATAKLLDYAGRADELQASHNPFAWIALAHLRTRQAHRDADALYAAKWQLTKQLYQHGWRKERIIILFKVLSWMMTLPASYQDQYWQAVLQMEKERKMEWISPLEQSFMDKGWEKGLRQGLEQGRQQGAALLLERQLAQRFGLVSQTTRKKLARASVEQLAAWSDALVEAQTLKQVFGQQ